MKAFVKKYRTEGIRRMREVKRSRGTKYHSRGRRNSEKSVVLSPAEEWLHLSPADADVIVRLLKTPVRINQAMRNAAERHAAIPQPE